MVRNHVDDSLDSTSTLGLIQAKFKVHLHDGEVTSRLTEHNVKGRLFMTVGGLELAEYSLWVSEDVLWSDEALHGSVHALDGCLSADCCTCSFTVAELLACSDGSPRDVVGHHHTNSVFDLERSRSKHSPINTCGCDCPVNYVINFV